MRDQEGLWRAILEQPDADTPRLVYADWLEEHGEGDRAEFIRVQIELARMSPSTPDRRSKIRREYELFARHGKAWSAPLFTRVYRWQFRRGFVEQVKSSIEDLQNAAALLWNFAPLRDLTIHQPHPEEMADLAGLSWLDRVERLDLTHSRMGDTALHSLLTSPHLGRLRRLVLRWCNLTLQGVQQLTRCTRLPALQELDLFGNERIGPAAIVHLLEGGSLPCLEKIDWDYRIWSPDVVAALVSSPRLAQLSVLRLLGSKASETQLAALLSRRLDRLEILDLRGVDLSPDLLATLAGNDSVRRLRVLQLGSVGVGDAGLATLASSPLAETLEELELYQCGITAKGIRALTRAGRFPRLVFLTLTHNPLGDPSCRMLAHEEALPALQRLSLMECCITSRGLRALLDAPRASRLGWLNVKQNPAISRRMLRAAVERFGEALVYTGMHEGYTPERTIEQAKQTPPRCLVGFRVAADSPLALRYRREQFHDDYQVVTFEILPPTPEQRPTMLGYRHRYADGQMLMTPLAVRWDPSGELVEFFDAEQHGYAAEHNSNCTVHGTGPRSEWECPHPGCDDHTLVASFRYDADSPPQHDLERHLPPQEQFRRFVLHVYCHKHDVFTFVTESECK